MDVHLPVTAALLSGVLLSLQIVLMLSVGMYRNQAGKGVGVDGDIKLERLVRRHGNFAENAAIFVVTLALYEVLFGSGIGVLAAAIVFALARLAHIIGFTSEAGSHLIGADGSGRVYVLLRAAGAGLTALISLVLGIALVVRIVISV
ncbi:MAG: MAPEG family protein [Pseudomonadota bacterium]